MQAAVDLPDRGLPGYSHAIGHLELCRAVFAQAVLAAKSGGAMAGQGAWPWRPLEDAAVERALASCDDAVVAAQTESDPATQVVAQDTKVR